MRNLIMKIKFDPESCEFYEDENINEETGKAYCHRLIQDCDEYYCPRVHGLKEVMRRIKLLEVNK